MLFYCVEIKTKQIELIKGDLYLIKIPNSNCVFWIHKKYVHMHNNTGATASLHIKTISNFELFDDKSARLIIASETVSAEELANLLFNKA